MIKAEAKSIIQAYVTGWVTRDKESILAVLNEDATIIEAHGIKHEKLQVIKKWLDEWLATGSTMDYWTIDAFYFDSLTDTAFFTWKFASTYEGQKDNSKGISLVHFKNKKIQLIQGYQEAKKV